MYFFGSPSHSCHLHLTELRQSGYADSVTIAIAATHHRQYTLSLTSRFSRLVAALCQWLNCNRSLKASFHYSTVHIASNMQSFAVMCIASLSYCDSGLSIVLCSTYISNQHQRKLCKSRHFIELNLPLTATFGHTRASHYNMPESAR